MRRLVFGIVALLATDAVALDQIAKQDSPIQLDIPTLKKPVRERYEAGTNDARNKTIYYAAQFGGPTYPRIQVRFEQLAGGWRYTVTNDVDETSLRSSYPFLKNREITELVEAPGGNDRTLRSGTFRVDGQHCLYWLRTSDFSTQGGGYTDRGLYCGNRLLTLNEVLGGVTLRIQP